MSELDPQTPNTSKPKSYDDSLFESFSEIASLQAYEYLNGDKEYRAEQKRSFIAGEIENPTLDYPEVDLVALESTEDRLLLLKQEVIENEQNEVVKQAYRWRLNEKIAEVRMLKAVASGDMRRFKRYSEFIYGKPSEEVFAYTVNSVIEFAEVLLNSDDEDVRQTANELLSLLPRTDESQVSEIPDQATVLLARDQTISEFGDLIDIPTDMTKLDADAIKSAFDIAIQRTGSEGWSVVIDDETSRTGISVDQEHMQVVIPGKRSVSLDELTKLIVHEIGTHVTRRANGERSQLKLLGLGLDRYESGEEGVATVREQSLSGEVSDFSGIDGLLAVGLSLGLDGQPRNFRQVYEILEKYYLLKNLTALKKVEEPLMKAQNTAYNRTVRTFRGTDCETPGVCFTKDIVYRNGNIGVWDVIGSNPDEMMRFNIGKYDPTNDRHLWILEQLGITDQDLAQLE
ncbi:MAG: tyrosine/phenylalanine carboxypeptidase domain-containing protein [Candidatus Saccharibacteria bacterium]